MWVDTNQAILGLCQYEGRCHGGRGGLGKSNRIAAIGIRYTTERSTL
jgi:hypothetical protein